MAACSDRCRELAFQDACVLPMLWFVYYSPEHGVGQPFGKKTRITLFVFFANSCFRAIRTRFQGRQSALGYSRLLFVMMCCLVCGLY